VIHGKQSKIFVNGHHLSKQFTSFDLQINADTADKTGFQSEAKEYNPGQVSAALSLEGLFNDTATSADKYLTDVLGASGSIWCIFPAGDAIGKVGYGIQGINNSHAVMATKDDNARISAGCQSNIAAERIISLLPYGSKTASGNGSVHDNGDETDGGGSAYLHVDAANGEIDVKIEHSEDGDIWEDLVEFVTVTAAGAQRVDIEGTIYQYTRVAYTLGEEDSITMQVSLHRKHVEEDDEE
jgi:hypothetical protein